MSLGEIVIIGLVALGAAIGLILALAGEPKGESEQNFLDRQW